MLEVFANENFVYFTGEIAPLTYTESYGLAQTLSHMLQLE